MHTTLVRTWMTPDPITAPSTMTLPEALELMRKHSIRRLPIVNNGKLIGIVTRGDLRGAQPSEATSLSIFELNYLVGRITLGEIKSRHVVTVAPTTTVQEAARLMLTHKIAALPVVADGRLVGIITESDVFRLVVKTWDTETQPELVPV